MKDFARQIAAFSLGQAGWFLALFAVAIGLVDAASSPAIFNGPRAKTGRGAARRISGV